MALISCPECNKEISEFAPSCPNCGFPLTPEKVALIKNEPVKHGFHEPYDIYEDYDPKIEEDYQKTVNKPKPKGEQKKGRQVRLYFVITIALIVWLLIIFFSTSKDVPTVPQEKTEKEINKDRLNKKIEEIISWTNLYYRVGTNKLNKDCLMSVYDKIPFDSTERRFRYATDIQLKVISINDSLNLIQEKANQKKWHNTKAGSIQKKHPNWTAGECEKIANKQVWIGMSYEMLIYERGRPNHINPSDYGNGKQYQCCWDYDTPSCFYLGEDQIVTSYN
jgi:flagellar basal body-associated protein FliL